MLFAALPESSHPDFAVRALRAEDVACWERYLNLPSVYLHTSWNHPTLEQLSGYLGNEQAADPAGQLRLAIALRETDELVGTIGFHTVSPLNRSAELTYDLRPDFWGRGVASALGRDVVMWAHEEAGVHRVQATVLDGNARSLKVLDRIGFKREGLLRGYRYVRGIPGDFHMLSHLAEDA